MDENPLPSQLPDLSGLPPVDKPLAWLSVRDAARYFTEAGMPRNKRSIRRYCERGDLDCRKTENALHQPQYFIDPESVAAYVEQQRTLLDASRGTSGPVQTDPDNTGHGSVDFDGANEQHVGENAIGLSRTAPGQTGQNRSTDVLASQLAERLRDKDAEIAFLRGELLHRRTTDTALHDVIAAFRANAEAQRLAAAPNQEGQGTTHREPPLQ
jgi:hypothetical protein